MQRKRTLHIALLTVLAAGTIAIGLARSTLVAGRRPDTQGKIADAMHAGPVAIAQKATILDYQQDAAGKFVVLRAGSNSWSCFPDTPGTPSDDPMCVDQSWMTWMYGLMANKAPTITEPGVAYMLQGGTDASNTDPMATKPAAGQDWLTSPPHIMILLPEKLDPSVIPTDPHNGGPWIMWAGTPFEHIMVPVSPDQTAQ